MRFALPPTEYNVADQIELRRVLQQSDDTNHKRESDVEIGAGRLILTRSSDGARFEITLGGSGGTATVVATAI